MKKTLAAFTAPGLPYPAYVNISSDERDVFFTVRGYPDVEGQQVRCGETVWMAVDRTQGVALLEEALANLRAGA